jgi:hypothetical protein
VPTGGNALLAETVEDTTEPSDAFVSQMGGTIVRCSLDEVVAELEAQQAAGEADKAARKAIREQKKQERKESFQQRVDALKAKFHKQ